MPSSVSPARPVTPEFDGYCSSSRSGRRHGRWSADRRRGLVEAGSLICGSPATVRDQISEFVRDFRIGNLHAMLQFGSMPTDVTRDNISLFAESVMPTLRDIWTDEGWDHHWWPQRLGGRPSAGSSTSPDAKAVLAP